MDNFGHFGSSGAGWFVDSWGAGPLILEHEGRSWRFEFSRQFGPFLLRKDGEIAKRQPGERSPFWEPFHQWLHQGCQLDGDRCVFDPNIRAYPRHTSAPAS